MKKYNLSKIMKRAWELVKKLGTTISCGLRNAWKEAKQEIKEKTDMVEILSKNLENMLSTENSGIKSGAFRKVSVNIWEKYGKKRAYLTINVYTSNCRVKSTYRCGYVNVLTNEYFVAKTDNINADTCEIIGRSRF